ncbi:MAG: glycine cleavage system aminomethyltransferase GcvT [Gemmatimonadales bacterium]|nr:MAG: glycine cleavage system aminomethyltransferase GcvT [Gemmatimonadales bacterium]
MKRTPLYDRHVALEARMVEFGGWEMPIQYPAGIVEEHLRTRRHAGLFDVSHMGRFVFRGPGALPLLQKVLTNNAAALRPGRAQYTVIPTPSGGALDDAYLYCLGSEDFLLVVNASNREKDWEFLHGQARGVAGLEVTDRSEELAMISLQGPESRKILLALIAESASSRQSQPEESIPEPGRNNLCPALIGGVSLTIARTGYTGDPLGFEFFLPSGEAGRFWDRLLALGAAPIGLGARDTLRLEAALPLYGHELGTDHEGREIPLFASPLARFAVSFSPLKGSFIGRGPLERQFAAYRSIVTGRQDPAAAAVLPRLERPVSLLDAGIARQGAEIFAAGSAARVGWITSGTMAPYWVFTGEGISSSPGERTEKRAFGIALLDSSVALRQVVEIDVRGRRLRGLVVPYLLRSEAAPHARPILWGASGIPAAEAPAAGVGAPAPAAAPKPAESKESYRARAVGLLRHALDNHHWRQEQCVNLIPSEMTLSPAARLLSISDPAFRYAEHRKVKALLDAEVFYYQGTGFIDEVEQLLSRELKLFLGCRQVETRLISGQMANTTVFSALVDYLNRDDRRAEPLRLRSVLNNHIIKGGHLSAQPMGALRDFVARDRSTESPAVTALPVRPDNPYQLDVSRVPELLERCRPQLVILGKSMIIHREPVAEIRAMIDALGLETVLMYDMAHVLGLVGPRFQEPFKEGADLVTGSTHKTFFGTQRGLVAADIPEEEPSFKLWEAVERRTFPGAVSNHHLGTLVGLLLAAYEMNAFRDSFQVQVLVNAKALARALHEEGLQVAGDPALGYTETHQVVVEIGYGQGVEVAQRLEENNIIVNYQASPHEEGFTAAGSLRLGVAEMTRFGMKEKDFRELAGLIAGVVRKHSTVRDEVVRLRSRFLELGYCFSDAELEGKLGEMRKLA